MTVGTGGAGVANGTGGSGTDSWFNTSGTVIAKAGTGGAINGGTVGSGGAAGSGIGNVTKSGGNGGLGTNNSTFGCGGGGGSAGDSNSGGNGGDGASGGVAGAAGLAGATIGATGGVGRGASDGTGNPGKAPSGGGGGGVGNTGAPFAGGNGANGLVRLSYTTTSPPPTTNTDLTNSMTTSQASDIQGDDGDYFIEFGSEYLMTEYKKKNTNNTDTPTFTWKGRTTESTVTSPMLFQIYNVNSSTWETLANVNKQPADTDFIVTVTQTTNISNYYDSGNVVSFRTYQLVV